MGLLFQHHVDQQAVADILFIRWAHLLEIAMAFPNVAHELFGLRNHLERIVVTYRNALRATLAFRWVHENTENRAFTLLLLLPFVELPSLCPLLAKEHAIRVRHFTKLLLPFALRKHLA